MKATCLLNQWKRRGEHKG